MRYARGTHSRNVLWALAALVDAARFDRWSPAYTHAEDSAVGPPLATHVIWAVLKAGEAVYHTGELPKLKPLCKTRFSVLQWD